jgi:hypothetical protein
MWTPQSINIRYALSLAAYHLRRGTRVPDGDLGFRCPACGERLVPREGVSARAPAHFDHFDVNSTCRLTRFLIESASRSDTLDRYLTSEALRAVIRQSFVRVSDDRDDSGLDGEARVPSPLRPAPFGRTSSVSVPEPDVDPVDNVVAAIAEHAKALYTRPS